MLRDAARSVGPDQWNPVQNRGYEVVLKEPSWPRDTFGEKLARGGLARRLGTRGPKDPGDPGMVWESWDGLGVLGWSGILGDPGTWETLRSGGS